VNTGTATPGGPYRALEDAVHRRNHIEFNDTIEDAITEAERDDELFVGAL